MAILIKLTRKGETAPDFYLNADKIISVEYGVDGGSTIFHEPLNIENGADWANVVETPEQIAILATGHQIPWQVGQ